MFCEMSVDVFINYLLSFGNVYGKGILAVGGKSYPTSQPAKIPFHVPFIDRVELFEYFHWVDV